MSQSGPPPPPAPKKGMSGCMIALLVFGGVMLVGVLLFSIGLWRALSTPEGKKLVKVFGDTAKLMEEAQNAPGAKEVRKKGGCQQALVIDMDKMAELFQDFADAGPGEAGRGTTEKTLVQCAIGFGRTPPTCDTLAQTYVEAAHPVGPFRVIVQKQGDSQPACSVAYSKTGEPLSVRPAE